MFYVYGDDSSDEKKERVCAVGVVAGLESDWQEVEQKWKARLGSIPFHARDCESDRGDFKIFCHAQNKELYRDLATILVNSKLGGLGVAFDLTAQKKVFPSAPDFAYLRAFMDVLDRVHTFAVRMKEVAKFTFDISTKDRYNAAFLYNEFRNKEPEAHAHFDAEISFVPASSSARVQAGDMMAFEAMKAMDHAVGPVKRKRGSWEALRATERFETFGYSEEWFLSLKQKLPELEKKEGFNESDYHAWLKKTKRQHSMSNLLYFAFIASYGDKDKK